VRGADGRVDQTHALIEIFLCEGDDQNRVLRGEPDGGEKTDLEKDVVAQARHKVARIAPRMPSGTTSMTANGIDQLS